MQVQAVSNHYAIIATDVSVLIGNTIDDIGYLQAANLILMIHEKHAIVKKRLP